MKVKAIQIKNNIYLIDEKTEIKEGDWTYCNKEPEDIYKIHQVLVLKTCQELHCKKIIATNNSELNLPNIDPEIIDLFVKSNGSVCNYELEIIEIHVAIIPNDFSIDKYPSMINLPHKESEFKLKLTNNTVIMKSWKAAKLDIFIDNKPTIIPTDPKQEAIKFAQFLQINYLTGFENNTWIPVKPDDLNYYTTENLYNLYKSKQ